MEKEPTKETIAQIQSTLNRGCFSFLSLPHRLEFCRRKQFIYCHNITKFSTFPNISGGKKYAFQTKINLHNSIFIRIFAVNKITIMRKKTYLINECEDWLFIEQNLPNYESRNDILYNDIVNRYVSGEEIDSHDAEMMQNDFSSFEEAEKWLDKDFKRLFLEAVEAVLEEGRLEAITCVEK